MKMTTKLAFGIFTVMAALTVLPAAAQGQISQVINNLVKNAVQA